MPYRFLGRPLMSSYCTPRASRPALMRVMVASRASESWRWATCSLSALCSSGWMTAKARSSRSAFKHQMPRRLATTENMSSVSCAKLTCRSLGRAPQVRMSCTRHASLMSTAFTSSMASSIRLHFSSLSLSRLLRNTQLISLMAVTRFTSCMTLEGMNSSIWLSKAELWLRRASCSKPAATHSASRPSCASCRPTSTLWLSCEDPSLRLCPSCALAASRKALATS
mmetsp:Transcript_9692/g.26234  ORF Transcript_9692/g.26234 Transcript_9692/m.26234 type:complete len:225 (+) Transcript_9692:3059-3733(+)